ncbi:RNA binding protein [Paecilomyces variotii No. 5]|uniref:Nucleolar protein 12 n=1 Tax=Byssochlamys spectabilis (strain No. 5 / NBRC 109023) TaxID=1356009 RepID=V5FLG7_BYSSN|nr:RNA binding protein [Paecilomyces variotii No. 5]
MGSKSKVRSQEAGKGAQKDAAANADKPSFLTGGASIDPNLASLFESSAGPVKIPSVKSTRDVAVMSGAKNANGAEEQDDEELSSLDEESAQSGDEDEEMEDIEDESADNDNSATHDIDTSTTSRKRKRKAEDNLEESYMRRIAQEEAKEEAKRRSEKAKRVKVDKDGEDDSSDVGEGESSEEEDGSAPPKHETVTGDAEAAVIDKSNRTVFLGNVSTKAIKSKSAKKTLLTHLASFLSTLPEADVPHKVESLRFRSTPFTSGGGVPKRAAYAKKEIMDETTPSTNAYVVYTTAQAARKAPAALNGTVVLDRHLRVDSVAHPAPVDNKRCVFVGNLDFIDQEPEDDEEEEEKKKKKKPAVPADVEEGLWRTFNAETKGVTQGSKRGNVESVRVVRDRATRVGKGFAYVQFYDPNCVEAALLLDGKKFPPLLPRKLRVTRARKVQKRREGTGANARELGVGAARSSLQGRATKLLGRAGAAKLKEAGSHPKSKTAEPFIFEGYRASEGSRGAEGAPRLKVKTKSRGASKGKPKTRSSRRAAAYKAAGGRKGAQERKP